MKYTTILFDLDGTLFDYDAAEANALKNTFKDFNLPFKSKAIPTYRELNARLWKQFEQGTISQQVIKVLRFEQLGEALTIDLDAEEFSYKYLLHLSEGTDLIDGARKIIEYLSDKVDLVLITNGLTIVQRPRIKNSGLENYFKEVIISEEVGFAKPDTKIFDITFERLNFPAREDVLIIGDSLSSDIAGGINYGIDTCWYNPSGKDGNADFQCTYTIKELNEIMHILLN
jgi:YjjG family noncanonical pyrimidine nucleotidase